ncbi:MAG: response regulator [Flavobacterium sp.]|nr:MAG: response regulator [Flavobacterium sp.]
MIPIKCVLLIDDNKIDNFFHERVIKKAGVAENVISAESGQAALDYLANVNSLLPDLIFLDINMPGMNGWEFIQHYKQLESKFNSAKIIIFTSNPAESESRACESSKDMISAFLPKPLTVDGLNTLLEKLSE